MRTEQVSDTALLRSYAGGDKGAITTLIERYRSKVYNYILSVVRSRAIADDIFQETFIKVMSSLERGKYTDNGKFVSWVLRIAHNQIIDHFRATKSAAQTTSEEAGYDLLNRARYSEATAEDIVVGEQTAAQLKALVETLPAEQRDVVMMRHYQGLSFKEIAEQSDVSINTALGRMRYALINLRRMIQDKGLEFR